MYYFYFMCDIFYIIAHLLRVCGGCVAAAGGSVGACPGGCPFSNSGGSVADDDSSDLNSFGSAGHLTDEHSSTIFDIS